VALAPHLDERGRRQFAAVEARLAGYGGIGAVARVTGIAPSTMLLPNAGNWQQEKAMLLGYARVSKSDAQETAPQLRALKEAGRKKVCEEAASGGRWDRPELHRLLDQLRADDTLVVWKFVVCPARSRTCSPSSNASTSPGRNSAR
jgi:hypothetical protein